ncbi:MAG: hypothetical protein ABSH35_35015 [Isosphaeraceae bacterium]|jgi:hypothetical protein
MNRSEHDTRDLWDSLLDLPPGHLSTWKQGVKAGNLAGKRASLPLRFGVRHLLGAIVLASLTCMAVRSLLLMEALGILLWPVLLGFGTDRMAGRDGILGGTIAGLVSFVAAFGIVGSGPQPLATGFAKPWFLAGAVLFLGAGGCWGFYLSVWVYLVVETILQPL